MSSEIKLNNSQILEKVLIILKNKKAGKKIVKNFNQFFIDFQNLKKEFHLTFPEKPDSI